MPSPAQSSSARASPWEWLQAVVLMANLTWTTLCLGGYRPETMVVASSLTGLLLFLHLLRRTLQGRPLIPTRFVLQADAARWDQRTPPLRRLHPAGWLLLPFLAYAAVNAAWITPVEWLGWHDWLFWGHLIAVFWVVVNDFRSPAAQHVLLSCLLALGVVAVGLALYQRFVRPDWLMLGRTQVAQFVGRSSGPFGIPNSLAAFLLLLLIPTAVIAFQWRRKVLHALFFGGCAVFFFVGLVLTISRGAWLGLALALAAWPLFATSRSWVWRMSVAGVALASVSALGAALYFSLPPVRERLDGLVRDMGEKTRPIMWRGAWQIFREDPVVGGGAGSYNILFERHRPENFRDEPQWAHNEYLNTLSDYGAVGFVLFFGAGGLIAWRCWRSRNDCEEADPNDRASIGAVKTGFSWALFDQPLVRQAFAIGVLAFAFQLFVDFHFKIPALAMIFATVTGLLVQRTWPASSGSVSNSSGQRLLLGVTAVGVLVATVCFVLPHYRGEAARYGIRRKMDGYALNPDSIAFERELLARAKIELARATELDPNNAQAWADRAYALVVWSRHESTRRPELGQEAEQYARRALDQAAIIPEFWLRLGTSLDLQGRWVEAGAAFVEGLRLAPANASMWYYQAYHFSLKPATRSLAQAAIATCLRLDPGNRDAEALRRRLAVSP